MDLYGLLCLVIKVYLLHLKKFIKARKEHGSISLQYTDRLNKLQSAYKDVPLYWFGILFMISFVILLVIFATDSLFMPWWCLIVALVLVP